METETLKQQKTEAIPKLRFGEFEKEWRAFKLNSKIEFISGYAFKSSEMRQRKDRYQLIKMSNLYQNELQLDRNPSFWKEINDQTKKFLLRKNDIILTLTGTVGKKDYGYSVVIPESNQFLLNQRLVCLRAKRDHTDPEFINALIKTSRFYYFFFNESKGGTGNQSNVGIEDLRDISLRFPSLPEQQKIASFLSAVDKKIQQLTRKKELLETYIKGVMQQLFSQEIRFKNKDGKDFPEWEEKRLGDVGKIVSGLTYSPNDIVDEGTLVLRSSNVHNRRLHFNDNVYVKVDKYNPVKENDILICVRNGSKRLIGKNAIIDKKNEGLAFGAFMTVYRSTYNLFLYHFFDSISYKKEVHKNLGATINSINGGDLKKFKIPFPSEQEQQKIADFLSAIDKKIKAVSQQIEKTQTFKKGLLQQMFV